MATPTPEWDGVIRELDTSFVRTLRRKLTAAPLFTPHFVRDEGVKTLQYKSYPDDDSPTTISMEVPGFSARAGKGPTTATVDVPILTRDVHWDKRDRLAAEFTGIDTLEADNQAFALARDINDYLYKGHGSTVGILNHPDVIDATGDTGSNWAASGNNAVKDLNTALKKLTVAEHDGPVVLLMSPEDEDLFGSFITDTSVQMREKMPGRVSNVMHDKAVSAGEFYLIEPDPRNFDAVVPRPVGGVGRVTRKTRSDEVLEDLDIRWETYLVPRIRHGDGVVKGALARA